MLPPKPRRLRDRGKRAVGIGRGGLEPLSRPYGRGVWRLRRLVFDRPFAAIFFLAGRFGSFRRFGFPGRRNLVPREAEEAVAAGGLLGPFLLELLIEVGVEDRLLARAEGPPVVVAAKFSL